MGWRGVLGGLVLLVAGACDDGRAGSASGADAAPLTDAAPVADVATPADAAPLTDAAPPADAAPPLGPRLGDARFGLVLDPRTGGGRLVRGEETVAVLRGYEVGLIPADDLPTDAAARRRRLDDPNQPRWHRLEWSSVAPCADGRIGWGGGCQGTLEIIAGPSGRFDATLDLGGAPRVANVRLVFDAPEGEAYYGLGEYLDSVNHRGRRRAMQFEVETRSEGGYNEAHVPIPLLIGTGGWGVFVEDRRPGDFDVAATDPNRIAVTFEAAVLRFHLFVADRPVDVLPHYVALTGQPALPAEWAFGGHIWRDENDSQAQVIADLEAVREHDLALSVIWIDRPWQTAFQSFTLDPDRFPDPPALVARMRELGFRLAFWSAPYLHPDLGEPFERARERGFFVERPPVVAVFNPFDDVEMLDFTDPGAADLFGELIGNAIDLGAEGFKLDYGEDIQVGLGGIAFPTDFANGETERTMHHGYSMAYHRPYAAATGGSGAGFILSRTGTYGDQRFTTTIWPGDLCNGFERHLEDRHVGGLPAAVIAGLSLSVSGYPFFASDTGGYRHGRAPKDVFLRWAAYSAFGSVMQTGGTEQHNPWDFAEYDTGRDGGISVFDAETLDIYRTLSRLHMRLYAYRYPYIQAAHMEGRPVTAPLGFLHPELGRHPDHVFLLGEDLLVAPVVDATGEVEVVLPAGRWFDWFTGESVDGPAVFTRQVPFDRVAAYARGGAIIPLLRETVDTLAPATDPGVDSYADDPGRLVVRVYPSEGRRTFHTLGDTRITVDGRHVEITGDHFTGYDFEQRGSPGGVVRTARPAGAQQFELPAD